MWLSAIATMGLATAGPLAQGVLQGRTPVQQLRICETGPTHGELCNHDADCVDSTCADRNRIDLLVAVDFLADATQLGHVETFLEASSAALFDATDGQFQLRHATIVNHAPSTLPADVRILPAFCTYGAKVGQPCHGPSDCKNDPTDPSEFAVCGYIPTAAPGGWKVPNGDLSVTMDKIDGQQTDPFWMSADIGHIGSHELSHLLFEVRDEYNQQTNLQCPVGSLVGEPRCLMSEPDGFPGDHEFCWAGNHNPDPDPGNKQESWHGHSCWNQVAWAFPDVTTLPVAAPDPQSNGALVEPMTFTHTDATPQVVLVLDRSGSMAMESPTRLARLQTAATNAVLTAVDDHALGIVSFATTASPDAPLDVPTDLNSATWTGPVAGLMASGSTHIGDALRAARAMLGGAAASGAASILLVTDGVNNQPSSNADADLADALADLVSDGVPVNVICIGSDLGLASQCATIASQTGGIYEGGSTSSAMAMDARALEDSFRRHVERGSGRVPVSSHVASLQSDVVHEVWIDAGAASAAFTALWTSSGAPRLTVTGPDGRERQTQALDGSAYLRVEAPAPGAWTLHVDATDVDDTVVLRGFVAHAAQALRGGVLDDPVEPGQPLIVEVTPSGLHVPLTSEGALIAQVIRPDGTADQLVLRDPDAAGRFRGEYGETDLPGPYTFVVAGSFDGWPSAPGEHDQIAIVAPRFDRELRLTGVVRDEASAAGGCDATELDAAGCDQPLAGLGMLPLLGLLRRRERPGGPAD